MESSVGLLWPTKYWNSYNRNHNSAVPQKQLNIFNKYLLLVISETDDNYLIRLEISNTSIQFDSKWKKHYSHSTKNVPSQFCHRWAGRTVEICCELVVRTAQK